VKPSQLKIQYQAGFTLVELLVSMALFIVILLIAAQSFKQIVTESSKLFKSEESNIEGVIGLEVMKHDLEQMGFGLPWGWIKANSAAAPTDFAACADDDSCTIAYTEAVDTLGLALNDAPDGKPRALVSFAEYAAFSSDYIGIKASTVGRTKAAQRWTKIPFHNFSAVPRESRPVVYTSNNLTAGDKVILINSNFNATRDSDHKLIVDPDNNTIFHINFNTTGGIASSYLPLEDLHTYMVYGIDSNTAPRMPFNRADFFIKVPGGVVTTDGSTDGALPSFCAPSTGVLYKATVNQSDGKYNFLPLLDCVADMQIVFGWDTSDGGKAGSINTYSSAPKKVDGSVANVTTTDPAGTASVRASINGWLTDARGLREHLKVVKVYILAQDGKLDQSYTTSSNTISVGDIEENNGLSPVKTYTLSGPQTHYRWKLYRLIVRPKNLVSNQQ
jgi:prepilin-type N-terminal cleavage/methylation domain-containing protein